MSWYSDGEPFNEYDPEWCNNCERDTTAEECRKCCELHEQDVDQ